MKKISHLWLDEDIITNHGIEYEHFLTEYIKNVGVSSPLSKIRVLALYTRMKITQIVTEDSWDHDILPADKRFIIAEMKSETADPQTYCVIYDYYDYNVGLGTLENIKNMLSGK